MYKRLWGQEGKKIKKHSPGMPAAKLEKKLSRSSIK